MKDPHLKDLQDLFRQLSTSPVNGLSGSLVRQRLQQEGRNVLPEQPRKPCLLVFVGQLLNWFSVILWIGGALCIATYIIDKQQNQPNLFLGAIIIFIIFLTAVITFMQTSKSEALMNSFRNLMPQQSRVVRDGRLSQVSSEELVRGDLVRLRMGDKIPADLRVCKSVSMKVDHSSLTGQSDPLLRIVKQQKQQILSSPNMCFFGTLVSSGEGEGVVVNVGASTQMGKLARDSSSQNTKQTPIKKELDRFVLIITFIAISLGIIFFLLARIIGEMGYMDCAVFAVGIIVANIPEGLLGCITISMAITAQRLHKKNILVKNLQAVETLGSTSCICSDKTGTLTKNQMTVQTLWLQGTLIQANNAKQHLKQIDLLLKAAALSSTAVFDPSNNGKVIGDASQSALLKFGQQFCDFETIRKKNFFGKTKQGEARQLFDSTLKYSFGVVWEDKYKVYIKGAPEKLISLCQRGTKVDQVLKINKFFSSQGFRVLGFGIKQLSVKKQHVFDLEKDQLVDEITFLGLAAIRDPPKDLVPQAVLKCKQAGIKVIMVTGDQAQTAKSIARAVGILSQRATLDEMIQRGMNQQQAIKHSKSIVVVGKELKKAIEKNQTWRLDEWVSKEQVIFARTTPDQKLQIVRACQRAGRVVAVTGDGVNDSAAIKQADIGISMGISGSDISKQCADMVLLDDNFASIVEGIEEGRKIFDNIKKTIVYLLTSNMTQIWPFLIHIAFLIPLPISHIFTLVICVGTDVLPAISLAYEDSELQVMTRRPRKPNQHLVSSRLLAHAYGQMGQIATAAALFCFLVTMEVYGFPPSSLLGLVQIKGFKSRPTDIFIDEASVAFGNTLIPEAYRKDCSGWNEASKPNFRPDWVGIKKKHTDLDLRVKGKWEQYYQAKLFTVMNTCQRPQQLSPITNFPICYRSQSLFYGQSAYLAAVVIVQWSNIIACKSRQSLVIYSGMNWVMLIGIISQTLLLFVILYVPGVNKMFGGRPLSIFLVGTPGLLFSVFLLIWSETRKLLMKSEGGRWFRLHLLW